jgi:hypothetical protein
MHAPLRLLFEHICRQRHVVPNGYAASGEILLRQLAKPFD